MRVADYTIDYIYTHGTDTIFTLAGGGAMFLNDATVSHKKIKYICHHHEQAAAMAAEAYAKTSGKMGVVIVTSGPGSTNAITGLLEAWQNSIPCIFISSQAKMSQMSYFSPDKPLRQFGMQELNIIPIVQSLTKYAEIVNKPGDILYHLEKAYTIALSGRPGPVWLDIPPDVAASPLDMKAMRGFHEKRTSAIPPHASQKELEQTYALLAHAKKPVIIAGGGIRLSGAVAELKKCIELLKVPVVVPEMGLDLFAFSDPYYMGHGGTKGQRSANMIIQNADLIISIGSRLAVSFVGHEYALFAPKAKIIVIDIDEEEHRKKTIKINQVIVSDALLFITAFSQLARKNNYSSKKEWLKNCQIVKAKYGIYLPQKKFGKDGINMYSAINAISKLSKSSDIYTFDAGITAYVCSQAVEVKKSQRTIVPGATLTMGYNLPAVIGIWAAVPKSRSLCITGDGSLQMNIHELQTIAHHDIPTLIFVINNGGYLAIRTTQKNFFQGRFIGESAESGISFPDLKRIAGAYDMPFFRIRNKKQLEKTLPLVMSKNGPVICEIMCPRWQDILSVSSKKLENGKMVSLPIDDMFPFLPESELNSVKKTLS